MQKFIKMFKESAKELQNVRCITLIAMFGAIATVLSSLRISIGDLIKISLVFLPNNIVYYLFGPVVGALYAGTMDILTYFIKPEGGFFPGFTLSSIVTGLIYGVILYKKPIKFSRIFISNLIQILVVSIVMNNLWLSMMNGNPFLVNLAARALKSVIMIPVQSIIMFSVMKGMEASGLFQMIRGNHVNVN